MKIKDLITKVMKQEGKKHQAIIGDVREIVGLVSDIVFKEARSRVPIMETTVIQLHKNGEKRAAKKPRKGKRKPKKSAKRSKRKAKS